MKRFLSVLITMCLILGTVAVMPAFAASDAVSADADALTIDDILSVPAWDGNKLIDNLDLDAYTVGEVNASPVRWTSTNTNVISTTGKVTRLAQDTEVTVTATIGEGDDIATKDFTFVVPAASKSFNGMPIAAKAPLVEEDFTGLSDVPTGSYLSFKNQCSKETYEVAGGKMSVTTPGWPDKETGISIEGIKNLTSAKSVVVEFVLHSTSDRVKIKLFDEKNNTIQQYLYFGPGANTTIGEYVGKTNKLKLTMHFNTSSKTVSVWVNNKPAMLNNAYSSACNMHVQGCWITVQGTGSYTGRGTVSLDNFKIYDATENTLVADYAKGLDTYIIEGTTAESTDGKTYLLDNINMNSVLTSGNTVTCTSSNENVISSAGYIKNGLVDTPVTVTAVISNANGETMAKSYDYVVPGRYNLIGKDANMPRFGNELINWNFEGTSHDKMQLNGPAKDYNLSYGNGKASLGSFWDEKGFKMTYPIYRNSGKYVQEIIFDTETYNEQNYGIIRIKPVNDWDGALFTMKYDVKTGKLIMPDYDASTGKNSETNTTTLNTSVRNKISMVIDVPNGVYDVYVNNSPAASGLHIKTEGWGGSGGYNLKGLIVSNFNRVGTTNLYSYRSYEVDETIYPPIMKGTEVISGDNKTFTVPVIATNAEGAAIGGTIVYAIYDVSGGSKELAGVKTVNLDLNEFSHREYTASVEIDSLPKNYETKIFYLNNMEDITPITAEDIPTK